MPKSDGERFGQRLREAATRMGFTSGRSRSGVDVVELSRVLGSSYEMARRYAEGIALPKWEAVRLIATWLKVDPSWLMYGEEKRKERSADTNQVLNYALLEECITAVAEAQKSAGITLSTDRQAQLVIALYQAATAGVHPSAASVAATLRALGAT